MVDIHSPSDRVEILSGIVGSTAYGLAREGSDVDRLGVFVAPTLAVAGLRWNRSHETRTTTGPDVTLHEVGKFVRLALKCNPSILELLWLPSYETCNPLYGGGLVSIRSAFLSEHGVRSAYGGYARQQAARLATRGDGTFSADTRNRTAKHARHLLRLLVQGQQLLTTGELEIRVTDPGRYFAFDHMSTDEMLAIYRAEDKRFAATKSVLPDRPDEARVGEYLQLVRRRYVDWPPD